MAIFEMKGPKQIGPQELSEAKRADVIRLLRDVEASFEKTSAPITIKDEDHLVLESIADSAREAGWSVTRSACRVLIERPFK